MRKLTLESLDVVSFFTGDLEVPSGTVRAHQDDATVGLVRTCYQAADTCGAFCVQHGNSLDPGGICGSESGGGGTGVNTCWQWAGCPGYTNWTNCMQYSCAVGCAESQRNC